MSPICIVSVEVSGRAALRFTGTVTEASSDFGQDLLLAVLGELACYGDGANVAVADGLEEVVEVFIPREVFEHVGLS